MKDYLWLEHVTNVYVYINFSSLSKLHILNALGPINPEHGEWTTVTEESPESLYISWCYNTS